MTALLPPREETVISNQPEAFKQYGRYTTFRALFERQYRGEQVGGMNASLHTQTRNERMLATEALRAANLFAEAMRKLGFEPIDKPEAYWFYGPYPPRDLESFRSQGKKVVGYAEGEDPDPDAADFMLCGYFLAPRGHITAPEPFK